MVKNILYMMPLMTLLVRLMVFLQVFMLIDILFFVLLKLIRFLLTTSLKVRHFQIVSNSNLPPITPKSNITVLISPRFGVQEFYNYLKGINRKSYLQASSISLAECFLFKYAKTKIFNIVLGSVTSFLPLFK